MLAPQKKSYRRKRKLGSYPYLGVIFSTSLSLALLGLTGLLVISTGIIEKKLKENVEIHIYLDSDISDAQVDHVITALKHKKESPFVLRVDDIPQVTYMSKDTAVKKYIADTGDDFQRLLDAGYAPIKANITINVSSDHVNRKSLETIKSQIEGYNGVFEVDLGHNLKDNVGVMNTNLQFVILIVLGLGLIATLIIIMLINNTIKLAMFSQRFLIRSMQLIGAKAFFIKKPFIVRTTVHGAIGGLLASGILYLISNYLYIFFHFDQQTGSILMNLLQLSNHPYVFMLFGGLCIFGAIIGAFSANRAVGKYLKMSLDDLY